MNFSETQTKKTCVKITRPAGILYMFNIGGASSISFAWEDPPKKQANPPKVVEENNIENYNIMNTNISSSDPIAEPKDIRYDKYSNYNLDDYNNNYSGNNNNNTQSIDNVGKVNISNAPGGKDSLDSYYVADPNLSFDEKIRGKKNISTRSTFSLGNDASNYEDFRKNR